MSARHKTLFLTDRSLFHQQKALESAPPNLHVTMLRRPARADLFVALADAEFLISERAGSVDAAMIDSAPRLRLIQRLGSLTHDIDIDAARRRQIPVCATPVVSSILVAEHMMMQMLVLAKRAFEVSGVAIATGHWRTPRRTDEDTFAYNWSGRQHVRSLYGATVGILGFGEIGVELARQLGGFRLAHLLYHKRQRLPYKVEGELGLTYASTEELVVESDFLCNLLPFFAETEMMLNAALLSRMKSGAFVVSCGSGGVIDEAALANAIRTGHLGGAALDTFEWEPLCASNPLVALARTSTFNVLLTPHTAAGTPPWRGISRADDFANVQRLLAGEPLRHRVA